MEEDHPQTALFNLAATGDAGALYDLANIAASEWLGGIPEAIGGAEVLLRLAAAADPTYRLGLAGFLLGRGAGLRERGEPERGDALRWQAIDLLRAVVADGDPDALSVLVLSLEDLANVGDEIAAVELNTLIASLPGDVAEQVRARANEKLENSQAQQRQEGEAQ